MFESVFILHVCLSYYMPFSSGTSGRLSTSCKKSAPSQIDGQELVSVLGNQTRWKLRMAVANILWQGPLWDDEIGLEPRLSRLSSCHLICCHLTASCQAVKAVKGLSGCWHLFPLSSCQACCQAVKLSAVKLAVSCQAQSPGMHAGTQAAPHAAAHAEY